MPNRLLMPIPVILVLVDADAMVGSAHTRSSSIYIRFWADNSVTPSEHTVTGPFVLLVFAKFVA